MPYREVKYPKVFFNLWLHNSKYNVPFNFIADWSFSDFYSVFFIICVRIYHLAFYQEFQKQGLKVAFFGVLMNYDLSHSIQLIVASIL